MYVLGGAEQGISQTAQVRYIGLPLPDAQSQIMENCQIPVVITAYFWTMGGNRQNMKTTCNPITLEV